MPAAPPPELDGRQRRHLRALGHHQKPVVQVGKALTPGVIEAVNQALTRHELVKVRVSADVTEDVDEVGTEIAQKTRSALAQKIGRTLLFYRPHPKKPRIVLPRAGAKP
jgi:RNA-binding protein